MNALTLAAARELGERLEAGGDTTFVLEIPSMSEAIVGLTRATELILTGEIIDAAEAHPASASSTGRSPATG